MSVLAPDPGLPPAIASFLAAARGHSGARRLWCLRQLQADAFLDGREPGSVRVAPYALIRPGQDPAARLAQARAVIVRAGWQAVTPAVDTTGPTDPATRPELERLFAAVARGELDGLVAASRTDISPYDAPYEAALRRLRDCGGFLALALDETAP
ncbi:hypothetical protein [Streptomyces sp. NPDC045470]|uniref:hypothetical protein n=1 Tax=Streptomyces sp. NPDC045470 TaxID=3155469 RepID=UPI0033D4B292